MSDELNKIKDLISSLGVSDKPDKYTQRELQDALNNDPEYLQEKIKQERAKTKKLEEENNALKDDRIARKLYGAGIFIFVGVYISAVLYIVAYAKGYEISDEVLKYLLGSATLNVIGLLAAVVRYLFPASNKK